jgi:hypothetical protein
MEEDEEAEDAKRRGKRQISEEAKDVGKNSRPKNPRLS